MYLDYSCPECKQFAQAATPTLNELTVDRKIKVVWHPLAVLDRASRPAGYSTRAAAAAGCASDDGKLKEYGEALFAYQPARGSAGLSYDQLIDIGGPLGLNAPSFAACVRDGKYRPWVAHVSNLAAQRGVSSMPVVYVNGTQLSRTDGRGTEGRRGLRLVTATLEFLV